MEAAAILGTAITKYVMNLKYMMTLEGSDVVANKFIERKETEDFQMLSQPYMPLANPIAYFSDLCRSFGREPAEYIDPELNQVVQNFLAVREMMKIGLPPDVAQAAVAQGLTPDDAKKVLQNSGAAQAKAIEQKKKEGEKDGGSTG